MQLITLNDDFLKQFDSYSKQDIEEGETYILIKGDIKVYLSHYTKYADMEDIDKPTAIAAVFKDHDNILKAQGTLEDVLVEIKKVLV